MEKCLTLRTDEFWKWFMENETALSGMVTKRDSFEAEAVVRFVSEGVGLLSGDINFNLGGDHEFTFAVSGRAYLFQILPYIVGRAPAKLTEKWRFFPGMRGTGGKPIGLQMYGVAVDTDAMMVATEQAEGEETAGLRFHSDALAGLPEDQCYILMENSIGEGLTHACVGQVVMAEGLEDGMFPLTGLEEKLVELFADADGNPPNPAQRYFTYGAEPAESDLPRADIFVGTGCCAAAINSFYDDSSECYDQFAGCGARLAYLYYPYRADEEQRAVLDERYDIMDRLTAEVLGEPGGGGEIGLVLGGAMGNRNAYADLLLFDQERFLERAAPVLAEYPRQFRLAEFRPDGALIPMA